jgi:hypothetical protein
MLKCRAWGASSVDVVNGEENSRMLARQESIFAEICGAGVVLDYRWRRLLRSVESR